MVMDTFEHADFHNLRNQSIPVRFKQWGEKLFVECHTQSIFTDPTTDQIVPATIPPGTFLRSVVSQNEAHIALLNLDGRVLQEYEPIRDRLLLEKLRARIW